MRLSAKSSPVPDDPYAPLAGMMEMAASMAQEISGKWPFAAARLRLELSGAGGNPARQTALGRALTLGLSGIVNGTVDARKIASVFALQEKMMAVRLSGRKLVAFHPDRDMSFSPERSEFPAGRVRLGVWSANGKLLGRIERFVLPRLPVMSMRSRHAERTTLLSAEC